MTITVDVSWFEENKYLIKHEDRTVVVIVNNPPVGGIEMYRNEQLVGLEILTSDGLYATDVHRSGQYKLNKVEDVNGNLL